MIAYVAEAPTGDGLLLQNMLPWPLMLPVSVDHCIPLPAHGKIEIDDLAFEESEYLVGAVGALLAAGALAIAAGLTLH